MLSLNATIRATICLLVAAILPLQPLGVMACSCLSAQPNGSRCQASDNSAKSCCKLEKGKSCCSSKNEKQSRSCCQSKEKSVLAQCSCCDHRQPEPQQNDSRNPTVHLVDITAAESSLADLLTICSAEQLELILIAAPQGNLRQAQLGVWLN